MRKTIAVDFDGCLCENRFPFVGAPNWSVINEAKERQRNGDKLILWTCRTGVYLEDAITACKQWGLTFDAINDSTEEWKQMFGNNPRKVGANEYWDDRAVRMPRENPAD